MNINPEKKVIGERMGEGTTGFKRSLLAQQVVWWVPISQCPYFPMWGYVLVEGAVKFELCKNMGMCPELLIKEINHEETGYYLLLLLCGSHLSGMCNVN
jgi:hypothetical protein